MNWRTWSTLLVIFGMATIADAQITFHPNGNVGTAARWWGFNTAANAYLGYGGYGYGYGGYLGGTPAESYARGQADLIRAQGMANQSNAAAAVNYEKARSQYLANEQQWLQIRAQRQAMGEQRRAEELAADRAARERRNAMQASQPPTAELSMPVYNPGTGAAIWPEVLQAPAFESGRQSLDDLLKLKVHTGDTAAVNQQILETATALRSQLKTEIRNVPPQGYIEARKFLDQLIDESRA